MTNLSFDLKAVSSKVSNSNKNIKWADLFNPAYEAQKANEKVSIMPTGINSYKDLKKAMRDTETVKFSENKNLLIVAINSGFIEKYKESNTFKSTLLLDFEASLKKFNIEYKL